MSIETAFLGHSPEVAQKYRDAAAELRRQKAQVPQDDRPAAPEAPGVDVGTAGQARNKRIRALRADLARLHKELQQSPIGLSGTTVPYLIERQRSLRAGVEAAEAEINRLAALDGKELADWAEASGLVWRGPSGWVIR